MLFHLIVHLLIDSCMSPEWVSNPQSYYIRMMFQPTELPSQSKLGLNPPLTGQPQADPFPSLSHGFLVCGNSSDKSSQCCLYHRSDSAYLKCPAQCLAQRRLSICWRGKTDHHKDASLVHPTQEGSSVTATASGMFFSIWNDSA